MNQPVSVFSGYGSESYPYRFEGTAHVKVLVGGTPSDPNIAESWLRTKLGEDSGDRIRDMVAELMVEQGMTLETATTTASERRHLNRIRKDEAGLWYPGRCLKAALKEAVSVACAASKLDMTGWGKTKKWLTNYFPEHVFVEDEKIYVYRNGILLQEPDDVFQQLVHTRRFGSSLQYQEYVQEVDLSFTIVTDHQFSARDWAMIWTTGESNGLGASRSMGYGTYKITRWEQVSKGVSPHATPRVTAKRTTRKAENTS